MSVDCNTNFGIGVKIVSEGYGDIYQYLDNLPLSSDFKLKWFEFEEDDDFYLCIGTDLTEGCEKLGEKIKLFEVYLKENKVEYEGKIRPIGGLYVC